jgi:RNA polymerase sporulation-specific sigma factor
MKSSVRGFRKDNRVTDFDTCSDEKLIEMLRSKEEPDADDIVDYIMNKYKPLVRKKTNALYLIGGETDDLVQEGMIGLFKAVRDYDEKKESSFYHFAELCINRQLYTALSASNRKKHAPLNSYVSFSIESEADGVALEELLENRQTENPEALVIRQEVWEEFKKRLWKQLSRMEQQVLALYLDGESYTAIAERMGKSPKSIDNALQRIRKKIGAWKAGE